VLGINFKRRRPFIIAVQGFTPSKSECRLQAIFQVVEKTGKTGKIYSEFFNVFRKLVMEIR
jgi:hypothetical protein